MSRTDVMVVGLGEMGRMCLENLVREPTVSKIAAADIAEEQGTRIVNNALIGASHFGYFPDVEFHKMDLYEDVSKNAEIIKEVNPRVILSNVAMISPIARRRLLPPEVVERIHEVTMEGPWFPLQLRLPYHLMQAVKQANIDTFVVNVSYPDAVGPALKTQGLAPTVGYGNLQILADNIRQEVANRENVKIRDVMVFLVSHHFSVVWVVWNKPDPDKFCPYFLKIFLNARDITDKYDTDELLKTSRPGYKQLGFSSTAYYSSNAAGGVEDALALIQNRRALVHVPAPNGIVGGYPARLGSDGPEIILPPGITMEEAQEINLQGQRRDGIEDIKDDGTIIFPDGVVEVMTELFSFKVKQFKVPEVDLVATELWQRLEEAAQKRASG